MSLKSSSYNAMLSGVGVLGSAVGWLVSMKILAYWLGPEGVGIFAQLRQYAQTATLVGTFGGTNLVVQGISSRPNNDSKMRFCRMFGQMIGCAGLGVAILTILFARDIGVWLFASEATVFTEAIRWLALVIAFNIAATYFIGILNGYHSIGYLAVAQLGGPVLMAAFMLLALKFFQLPTMIVMVGALGLCFAVTMFLGMIGARSVKWAQVASSTASDGPNTERFSHFASVMLVVSLLNVVVLLLIRSWIISVKGLVFSGLFEVGWTLTFNYMTLFLTACNTLYLPRLSAASDPRKQRDVVLKTAYVVFCVNLVTCYGLTAWPRLAIHLFFTPAFDASEPLLYLLVIAVFLRSISWTYGTVMLATRALWPMLLSDILMNGALLLAIQYVLEKTSSLEALGWAFVMAHLLYLVIVIEYARVQNPLLRRRKIWPFLVSAIFPLFVLYWLRNSGESTITVIGPLVLVACGVVLAFVALGLFRKVDVCKN